MNLEISVSPKIHAIFFHVDDYCELSQEGLGFASEQTSESVHYDFGKMWQRYKIGLMDHPDYSRNLLKCTIAYNSKHL